MNPFIKSMKRMIGASVLSVFIVELIVPAVYASTLVFEEKELSPLQVMEQVQREVDTNRDIFQSMDAEEEKLSSHLDEHGSSSVLKTKRQKRLKARWIKRLTDMSGKVKRRITREVGRMSDEKVKQRVEEMGASDLSFQSPSEIRAFFIERTYQAFVDRVPGLAHEIALSGGLYPFLKKAKKIAAESASQFAKQNHKQLNRSPADLYGIFCLPLLIVYACTALALIIGGGIFTILFAVIGGLAFMTGAFTPECEG